MFIAFITALLGLPTGFAAGWLMCQLLRDRSRFARETGYGDTSFVAQVACRVQGLAQQLRNDVGRHHTSLRVAHAELQSGDHSVVERMLSANDCLLERLADAEEQFVDQQFAIQQYMQDACQDALTSLENRRAFDKELAARLESWKADEKEFCLAMVDVDHFKRINDEYGHPVGDEVLKAIARTLAACARPEDSVSRLGGEEFGILLANCSIDQGRQIVDRLRHSIADHPILVRGAALRVTVSLGLACVSSVTATEDLMSQADRALYSAKKAGRNRCYYFSGHGYDPACLVSAHESANQVQVG